MDYKKKYKEAFKRAKGMYEQGMIPERLEYIFPELKELEDEIIRKSITEFFKNFSKNGTYKAIPNVTKWITWLEKQKTSDKALQYLKENHSPSEVSDFQAAMNIAVAKAYDKGYNDGLEKQGENFPILSNSSNIGKNEQKPAWSEEDVHALNTLSAMVANNCLLAKEEIFKLLDWLNSIKSRLYLQEWSEADKRKINRIYSILKQAADTHAFSTSCRLIGDKECIELQDFLKSIRPQPQWKPSGFHLECIEDAISLYEKHGINAIGLKEILDELKKLKE